MTIFSLKSKSLDHLNIPFYAENERSALAMIRDQMVSDANCALSQNAHDLVLVKLGTFDNQSGIEGGTPELVDFDLSSFQKEA